MPGPKKRKKSSGKGPPQKKHASSKPNEYTLNGVAIVKEVGSGNAQCQVQGAFVVVSQDAVQKMSDQELKYYLLYKGAGGRGNAKPKWWPEKNLGAECRLLR